MTKDDSHQLLVEGHTGQVLPEDLAVHVHPCLSNVHVPIHFWENALSTCMLHHLST